MQRTSLATVFSVILALSLISVGCGDDHHSTGGAMAVQSVQPSNAGTCVAASATIQITFSTAADPATVNATNIQVDDGSMSPIAGTVTYDSNAHVATFTPDSPLASDVTYTVKVSGVKSSIGAGMTSPFSSTFTTGPCADGQAQYKVSLFSSVSGTENHGEISVDTSGVVSTHLTGATASTAYTLNFCPSPGQNYTCFKVGDVTTDGSGNADTTANFPQSGSWAGDFQLASGGTSNFSTNVFPGAQSLTYTASLQPASTTNGNGAYLTGAPGPQDPLSSGTVTISSGAVQVALNGAAANSTYSTTECPIMVGSSCFQLVDSNNVSGFTTDASGDVSYSVLQDGSVGDIFRIDAPTGRSGYIAGFKVP